MNLYRDSFGRTGLGADVQEGRDLKIAEELKSKDLLRAQALHTKDILVVF